MKHQFIYIFILVTLIPSCAKQISVNNDKKVNVCFSTKAGGSILEETLSSADILVFRSSDGVLLDSARVGTNMGVVALPTNVPVDFHVVTNVPPGTFSMVKKRSDLLSVSLPLEDCVDASKGFVMTGFDSGTFDADHQEALLDVKRLSCKVTIGNIIASFLESSTSIVTIDSLFLINAAGDRSLNMSDSSVSRWFNKMGQDTSLGASLKSILEAYIGTDVSSASPLAVNQTFYCLPNHTQADAWSDTAPLWSPRHTRMVAQLTIDGEKNFYPVTLPVMEPNCEYRITDLQLLGPGSTHPDKPVNRSSISYSIQIADWVDLENVDVTF